MNSNVFAQLFHLPYCALKKYVTKGFPRNFMSGQIYLYIIIFMKNKDKWINHCEDITCGSNCTHEVSMK